MTDDRFETILRSGALETERTLEHVLSSDGPLLAGTPPRLLEAMRYAALGGGKRLRPLLVREAARLFGGTGEGVEAASAAIELVHCYSLVHDDLPAMDDDDLRRGRPTVHRAFDEATAILAGDALLTLAFGVAAQAGGLPADRRAELVLLLARDGGAAGMAGGQALDLAAEREALDEAAISRMQAMKTGALIAAACEMGAVAAGAHRSDRARLRRFGETVGLAFQLADDLLDETGSAATLGKAAGKDRQRGKKTLPALHGIEWTQRRIAELVRDAEAILAPFDERAETLRAAARFVAGRAS